MLRYIHRDQTRSIINVVGSNIQGKVSKLDKQYCFKFELYLIMYSHLQSPSYESRMRN